MGMTELELESLLKAHGWYLRWSRQDRKRFAVARRRAGKTVLTRYIIAESRLSELTEGDVLKRLQS
jgi:hypothetical protein